MLQAKEIDQLKSKVEELERRQGDVPPHVVRIRVVLFTLLKGDYCTLYNLKHFKKLRRQYHRGDVRGCDNFSPKCFIHNWGKNSLRHCMMTDISITVTYSSQ